MKVYLHGKSGRMGKEIESLISQNKSHTIADKIQNADVIIDFTSAEGISDAIALAEKNKLPLVSGSTGLQKKDFDKLKKLSQKTAVLWSSNMSLGVAVLGEMLKNLSQLKEYDFYIEETHHAQKKDQPSGTALTLQEKLEKSIDKKIKQNISIRGGGVFGQHKVIALGPEETIVLQHDALSRTVFARGALTAAKWLLEQKPGFYKMEDIFFK